MLITDATEQDSQTKVNLLHHQPQTLWTQGGTYLGMYRITNARPQQIDQLLLNHRQLSQESIFVTRENRIRQSTQAQCSRQTLQLAIRKDISRRYSRDLG